MMSLPTTRQCSHAAVLWTLLLAGMFCLTTKVVAADDATASDSDTQTTSAAGVEFFESKIRPVLIKHCYDCHSAESGAAEAGLRVDSRSAIRQGGERGAAVVPGRPEASLLLTAIAHTDSDLKMPPKADKLPDQVVADIRKWIEMGAPDPRMAETLQPDDDWSGYDAARQHWAYQSPTSHDVPTINDSSLQSWARDDVDRFVSAKLVEQDLKPSADAELHVLLRRLHFDLVGLPPSPADLNGFLKACEATSVDDTLAAEVDRLLESPQFGERWGRHWLDVARFGESSGGESNVTFPYAWRYRDYVIDSVNADIPYNRFLTEQIAGDLLPAESDAERARMLIATGYLAVGTKNLGENNDEKFLADVADEQIDSLTRGVLASSVACARCHHHKFDPFTMEDYYALAGIFASSKAYFGTFTSPANNRGGDPLPLPKVEGQAIYHESLSPEKFAELTSTYEELDATRKEIQEATRALFSGETPKKTFTLTEVLGNIWRLGPVEGKLEILDNEGNAIPVTMGMLDQEKIVDVPVLARGEIGRPGEIVPRRFPQALNTASPPDVPDDHSGRLQLAEWLTDPQHPLTSRVFVNRVWHHLFGAGLVATVDNFGTTGAEPSHPELLDTLAVQFTEEGWSLKQLVRRLVLTRTYRQASTFDQAAFLKDPNNSLLWRMPKQRLEAEAIRDAMLAVAGELDTKQPGGSLVATIIGDRPVSLIGLDKRLPPDLDGVVYRSIYLPVIRDRLPDVLELFDFAEPSLVTGERETTNVPVQALYLMNSSFVQDRARGLASRITHDAATDIERVNLAFRLCFCREPDVEEQQWALVFINQSHVDPEQRVDDERVLVSFCQALLSTAEFRNLD